MHLHGLAGLVAERRSTRSPGHRKALFPPYPGRFCRLSYVAREVLFMPEEPKSACPSAGHETRTCLMCGDAFRSDGVHNRICPRCKLSRRWREGGTSYSSHEERRRSR